jgi:hypothetical protein
MKSCEEQLEIERQKYIAAETKKGFNEAAILTTWKESVMKGDTVEQKLSAAKKLNSKAGISESAPISESRRIERKNGSAINEAGTEDRVQKYMKKGFTLRESYVMCGLKDPGPKAKQPAAFTESLVKAWKDYCGGLISEADCKTLAEKGISPE